MRTRAMTGVALVGLLALGAASGGCVAAAAGAAGGIYLTSRGAESLVNATTDEATNRARAAFQSMGIQETGYSTDDGGDEQELKGTSGDIDVTVDIERESSTTTKVEVTAKKSAVNWEKDYAKQVLSRIVEGS